MNNRLITRLAVFLLFLAFTSCDDQPIRSSQEWAIVVHGGAGSIVKGRFSPEKEAQYIKSLQEALDKGSGILQKNGSALDAVEQVIRLLEDNPLFNAGKGAVLTHEKKVEMDASIMNGANLEAGAVASVTTIKHPITAARAVMEKSPHVLLMGPGAEAFAKNNGLEMVPNDYFITPERKKQIEKRLKEEMEKHGTVGVVALDKKGNLAAGTSTGGMTDKQHGRVGDSPIIGAGTYADNRTCAVSCTGHGEFFIRLAIAHSISELMKMKKISVEEAAKEVIFNDLDKLGGSGGVIALDKYGNYAMEFNTKGMFRGYANASGTKIVEMY